MLAKYAPTHVIHLAARVGGIGYNQVAPAPLYFDNLMMGTHVIEAARTSGVEKLCCLEQSAVIPSSHQCPLLKHRYGMVIQKKQMRPTESLKSAPHPRSSKRTAVRTKVRILNPNKPLRTRR